MKIKFSRHAKRKSKLYKISLSVIKNILKNKKCLLENMKLQKKQKDKKFPIKIVINVENDITIVITNYPLKKEKAMKIYYDKEVDALYIKLSNKKPDGVIEIDEGVNLDTTEDSKIVGIEILDASHKIDLKTILNYSLAVSKEDLLQIFF